MLIYNYSTDYLPLWRPRGQTMPLVTSNLVQRGGFVHVPPRFVWCGGLVMFDVSGSFASSLFLSMWGGKNPPRYVVYYCLEWTRILLTIAFYFNFKQSILGEFIPSPLFAELPIPHRYFLATPLLLSGVVNGEVRKFTGNGQIGPANDDITRTAHAFAHFSLLYSQRNILFCDLQGK